MRRKWTDLTEDEQIALQKKINTCECCKKELTNSFAMKRMNGIADTKMSRACPECAELYFEEVKSKYLVEEYRGNRIYKYEDKYFPYWDAKYYFNSIEDCMARIDSGSFAMVDMDSFHTVNKLLK